MKDINKLIQLYNEKKPPPSGLLNSLIVGMTCEVTNITRLLNIPPPFPTPNIPVKKEKYLPYRT
jgi:hypothetical protein